MAKKQSIRIRAEVKQPVQQHLTKPVVKVPARIVSALVVFGD